MKGINQNDRTTYFDVSVVEQNEYISCLQAFKKEYLYFLHLWVRICNQLFTHLKRSRSSMSTAGSLMIIDTISSMFAGCVRLQQRKLGHHYTFFSIYMNTTNMHIVFKNHV